MLVCLSCGIEFTRIKTMTEIHNLSAPPYEEYICCPYCGSTNIKENNIRYCKCCGARMIEKGDFCSVACRNKAIEIRKKEIKRQKSLNEMPINIILREVEEYNQKNNSNYSYGQYVAIVKPKLRRRKKK